MTDTTVKFLHSAMAGAPALSGSVSAGAGSLIPLLDACLLTGFGSVTVDSIVVAGGLATVTRGSGLPFEAGSVATIAGATITGGTLNGERKIITVTPTTATFDATGIPDGTASGTITAKFAPLGWSKPYSATGLAVYKPTDVAASGCMLRVDDTVAQNARVRGFEAMSDVNTGTGLFPTDSNVSGGLYWPKSTSNDATARAWVLVGDGRIFYLMVAYSTTAGQFFGFNHVFGDIASAKSPDAYACLLHGFTTSSVGTAGSNSTTDFDYGDGGNLSLGSYLPRGYAGIGGNASARKVFPLLVASGAARSGAAGMPFPNYADGGLYLSPVYLSDHLTGVFRGVVPGLFGVPHQIGPSVFNSRDFVSGVTGYAGRTFRIVNSASGCFAFDVTGPWR